MFRERPPTEKVHVNDLFLSQDERYEIYEVKAAERPHLLAYTNEDETISKPCADQETDSESSVSDEEHNELALIDGCDIHGWRKERLVNCTSDTQGVLNIGISSTMFRRESTLITSSNFCNLKWKNMKNVLLDANNITQKPNVINHDEYKEIIDVGNDRKATKFAIEYEQKNIPVIIQGAMEGWDCMPTYNIHATTEENPCSNNFVGGWTFSNLLERFHNVNWRFSDIHGEMMGFETYAKYISQAEGLMDDSPLAIYDSEFGDLSSPTHQLIHEYQVPECFSPCLFELAEDIENFSVNSDDEDDELSYNACTSRPPYRWVLIGPERSGTGMHVDPLWTNAWVAVLQGKKRWMLFPPETPLHKIGIEKGKPQMNSATWYSKFYDKVTSAKWPIEWRPYEVLQNPGEIVFVPNGWPHLVVNLELTVAVTHNYASEFGPFARMYSQISHDEPEFFASWLKGIHAKRPDLLEILNGDVDSVDEYFNYDLGLK